MTSIIENVLSLLFCDDLYFSFCSHGNAIKTTGSRESTEKFRFVLYNPM